MSDTTQLSGGPSGQFTERTVEVDGAQIRYREAGCGKPLIVLDQSAALAESRLYNSLAQHFRVIAFHKLASDVLQKGPASDRELAQKFIRAANALNLQNYGLIGASDAAQVAIWQAIYSPECVDALVLISPPALPHEGQAGDSAAGNASELVCPLEDLKAPTLVLLGTEDRTVLPETGRTYAQRIPKCYYVLVYAAGHALAEECPEQLSGIAQDFLERRESFIVNRSSTLLTA